jgi:hypothetical protein
MKNTDVSQHISRRRFFRGVGLGLANVSILSLLGCQATEYDVPQIIEASPSLNKYPPKHIPNQSKTDTTIDNYPRWLPLQHLEDKARWNAIIVHHTATQTGSASVIDRIHKNRGFDGLGYDFIINSGNGNSDGLVEVGYRWRKQLTGAHCHPRNCSNNYWNKHSIGIALIGNFEEDYPTPSQYKSLAELIVFLKRRYHISSDNILGHKQVPGSSTKCPGKNFSWYRFKAEMHKFGISGTERSTDQNDKN